VKLFAISHRLAAQKIYNSQSVRVTAVPTFLYSFIHSFIHAQIDYKSHSFARQLHASEQLSPLHFKISLNC